MIREKEHNATAFWSEKTALKLVCVRDIGTFARRDKNPNMISLECDANCM